MANTEKISDNVEDYFTITEDFLEHSKKLDKEFEEVYKGSKELYFQKQFEEAIEDNWEQFKEIIKLKEKIEDLTYELSLCHELIKKIKESLQ